MFNQEKPSSKIETVVRELRKLKVMSAEWHVAADGRNIKEKLYSEIGELANWSIYIVLVSYCRSLTIEHPVVSRTRVVNL